MDMPFWHMSRQLPSVPCVTHIILFDEIDLCLLLHWSLLKCSLKFLFRGVVGWRIDTPPAFSFEIFGMCVGCFSLINSIFFFFWLQATLYKMAERIIAENAGIQEVSYALPNKHYIPVDMRYIGIDNLTPCVSLFLFFLFRDFTFGRLVLFLYPSCVCCFWKLPFSRIAVFRTSPVIWLWCGYHEGMTIHSLFWSSIRENFQDTLCFLSSFAPCPL